MGDDGPINPYAPPQADAQVLREEEPDASSAERAAPSFVDRPKTTWMTVASFGTVDKAVEALRLLEKSKINSRVLNDGTVDGSIALHWVRSMPLGGHRVQVQWGDFTEAAAVLGVSIEREDYDPAPVNVADERMKKALVAAVLGTFLCPGVAHAISLMLVFATPRNALTAIGRTRRR